MKHSLAFLAIVLGLALSAGFAQAAPGCPEMPVTVIHRNATKGSVEASLLTKLISRLGTSGEVDRVLEDAYQKDGSIERAKMVLLTYECQSINDEFPRDPGRRREEFRKVFFEIFSQPNIPAPPAPTPSPPLIRIAPTIATTVHPRRALVPSRTPDIVARNPEQLPTHPTSSTLPQSDNCGDVGYEKVYVAENAVGENARGLRHFRRSGACSFKLEAIPGISANGQDINVMAMKGGITYQQQVDLIKALLRSGVHLEAVCASTLPSQPSLSILLAHANFQPNVVDTPRLTAAQFEALAETSTARQFNILLSGQKRCAVP